MKTAKRLLLLFLTAVLLISAAGCRVESLPSDASPTPFVPATPNASFHDAALTVGDMQLSVVEYNYYYRRFYEQHAPNLSFFGVDLSVSLREQSAEMITGEADKTVDDVFHEMVLEFAHVLLAVVQAAERDNFALTQEELDMVEDELQFFVEQLDIGDRDADDVIAALYGYGCTLDVIRLDRQRLMLAQRYFDVLFENMTYTDAELDAFYLTIADDYDVVDYRAFSFYDQPEGLTEDASEDEIAAAVEAAMNDARQKAEAMLAAVTDEASFISESASRNAILSGDATLVRNAAVFELPADISDFLFDGARQPGDISMIRGFSEYTVVMFIARGRDESPHPTVDVRHILYAYNDDRDDDGMPTEANRNQARVKAEALYEQWLAGDRTEDSFALLASANSDCPSRETGGMLPDVERGQMVPDFNDWCFANGRRAGDHGVIEAFHGFHIMYMSSVSDPMWKAAARHFKSEEDFEVVHAAILDSFQLNVLDFDRSFVDTLVEPVDEDAVG
jgi:hypothetical protein